MLDSRAGDVAPRCLGLAQSGYCGGIGQDSVLEGHPKQEDHAALT